MRARRLWCWALLCLNCGGSGGRSDAGADCTRDDDCDYGLVCVASQPGAARHCTAEVTPIVTPVDPALLTPNPTPVGNAGSAGAAPVNQSGSPGSGGYQS